MQHIGRKVQVGIGKETVRGTAVAASRWLHKDDASFGQKSDKKLDDSSIGNIADSIGGAYTTQERAEGEVSTKLGVNDIGLLLLATLGSVSSGVDTTGAYAHEFSVNNTNLSQSLSVVMADEVQDYVYANCMVDSLEIQSPADNFVSVKATFKGKKGATTTASPSYAVDYVLMGKHTNVRIAAYGVDPSGETPICVSSLRLQVNKNVVAEMCNGNTSPQDFLNTVMSVEGSMELTYKNTDQRTRAFSDGTYAMLISMIDGNTIIGSASNPELSISLPKVSLMDFSSGGKNNEIVKQTVTFRAVFDITSGKQISATLVNTTATY